MVKIMYGDEPYLIANAIQSMDKEGGVIRFSKFSEEESSTLSSMSLFGTVNAYYEVEKVSDLSDAARNYLSCPCDDSNLIVVIGTVKSGDLEEIKKYKAEVIKADKVTKETLEKFVIKILKDEGCKVTQKAFESLISRLHYEDKDNTLFYVKNAVLSLTDGTEEITEEVLDRVFPDKEDAEPFGISKLLEAGNYKEIYPKIPMIQRDFGVLPFMGVLMREFRIAYKKTFAPLNEIGVKYTRFGGWQRRELVKAMELISKTCQEVKNSDVPENRAIEILLWRFRKEVRV